MALFDRYAARDFVDVFALIHTYDKAELLKWAPTSSRCCVDVARGWIPPADVDAKAGQSVEVLLKVCAKCPEGGKPSRISGIDDCSHERFRG